MQRTLQHLAHCCHGDDRPDCPILDDLAGGAPPEDFAEFAQHLGPGPQLVEVREFPLRVVLARGDGVGAARRGEVDQLDGTGMFERVEKNSLTLGATSELSFCLTTTPSLPERMRTSEPIG